MLLLAGIHLSGKRVNQALGRLSDSILGIGVFIPEPLPVSSDYNGGHVRGGESGHKNRPLLSRGRITRSVPIVSRDCGWRRARPRLVDFGPLANLPADNVSRGEWWFGRRSHCLSDFRSIERGCIRSCRNRFSICLSPLSIETELNALFFSCPVSAAISGGRCNTI